MTLQTIQELRELEGKATPGEWHIEGYSITTGTKHIADLSDGHDPDENMELICDARSNLPALLDMAEECLRLREEVRELKLASSEAHE